MADSTVVAVIELFGDDVLRSERIVRALGRDLAAADVATARFEYVRPSASAPGAKGQGAEVLRAVLEYAWPAAAPLVAEGIKALCSREKHETVRITVGENYVEIKGDPSPEQAALLSEVLRELPR